MIALLLIALASQTQDVEVDPVTCWWRTSATSIRVGEAFEVILTCALLQTDAARVVADESRLEPSVVQLPPFDVVGGARAKDITTAGRRFIQFEYRLRTIAENVFASQAALPPLEITYRVESRVSGGNALAGRDRTYAMPPLAVRVLSLVPDSAEDIREAPVATFAEIERRTSAATAWRAGGFVVLALGGLLTVLALAGVLRRRQAARVPAPRLLPPSAILGGVRRELNEIEAAVRASGWTPDLAGRTLAAVRVIAAYAAGRSVAQRFTADGSTDRFPGEIVVRTRSRTSWMVSSPVAAAEDAELQEAMARLTTAHYGREAAVDGRLDDTLDVALRRTDRLMAERPWTERLWAR